MADTVIALVAATALLVLVPGPNVALIVTTSLAHGRGQGLRTVAGTTAGVALQLALVVLGYAALLSRVAAALLWVKWLGVACLLWLGVRAWRSPAPVPALGGKVRPRSFRCGMLLAIVNPKTLLFNAAFLPQFIGDAAHAGRDLPLLAAVYLCIIACGDSLWVLFAGMARGWLQRHGKLSRRITGTLLIGAGAVLALARGDRH